jgi:adenine/guanine phosphoribosyltransferase-like PRPP-binding protein
MRPLLVGAQRVIVVDDVVSSGASLRAALGLLAMVGSLFGADGLGRLLEIYGVAVGEGYRFYSYGDAMLILP